MYIVFFYLLGKGGLFFGSIGLSVCLFVTSLAKPLKEVGTF